MAPRISKKSPVPSDEAPPRAAPPPRDPLRLGCAPLITGICLVALLGKLLPHEPRRSSAQQAEPGVARPAPPEAKAVQPERRLPPPDLSAKPSEASKPAAAKSKAATPDAAKPGIASLVDRAIGSNGPWNGGGLLKQAERYLKNSLYDAASFEALEWGSVVESKKGYQVRCKFRSKNVLGVYVTQSKTVLLAKSGEAYALKD
jgi:hypothetical protein